MNHSLPYLLRLKKEPSFRSSEGVIFIEGDKLIDDLKEQIEPTLILSTSPQEGEELISEAWMQRLSSFKTPSKRLALFPFPEHKTHTSYPSLLLLDRVQDPGNIGTLIRSAWALGWDGVAVTEESADPWSDKALRASQGAPFFFPVFRCSLEDVPHLSSSPWVIADLEGKAIDEAPSPCVLLLSHEGQGPRQHLPPGVKVTIPIMNTDSLNVAAAGAILLHALRPKRGIL